MPNKNKEEETEPEKELWEKENKIRRVKEMTSGYVRWSSSRCRHRYWQSSGKEYRGREGVKACIQN